MLFLKNTTLIVPIVFRMFIIDNHETLYLNKTLSSHPPSEPITAIFIFTGLFQEISTLVSSASNEGESGESVHSHSQTQHNTFVICIHTVWI